MNDRSHKSQPDKPLESVHVCPKCGSVTKTKKIDLKSVATGILICRACGWSGPINVRIVEVGN